LIKLKTDSVILKFFFIFFLLLLVFNFFAVSEFEPFDLTSEERISWWLDHYRELRCEYGLSQVLGSFNLDEEIYIRAEPSGNIECFGKNFWVDYSPEKKIEDGWDNYSPKKFTIRISTNVHLDLLLQSLFFLTFLSFIPKTVKYEFKYRKIVILLATLLYYLHLYGEKAYYSSISRDFDYLLIVRDYEDSISFNNFYIYSYLLLLVIIFYFLLNVLETRLQNIINYFPFIFLVWGTYSSLNLNFFFILFSIIGISCSLNKKPNLKFLLFYSFLSIFWLFNSNNENTNFDVDKIRGFINTSESYGSILFWIIVFYFIVIGFNHTISISRNFIDVNLISKNLLISSSLIVVLGLLSSINQIVNFFTYYFLGLNKTGMGSFESIAGNTWRGLAPSAEGVGEFYAFVILFFIYNFFILKNKMNNFYFLLLVINCYGLYRSNNFAALISMFIILILFLLQRKIANKKIKLLIVLFLAIVFLIIIFVFFSDYSFDFLSNIMLFEGVMASNIQYEFELNQYNQSAAEQANYGLLLKLPDRSTNFSTSLKYLINSYTYGNKISNFPSLLSVTSAISYFINRSEKWGIFFSKYNPDFYELMFGYGPYQLSEYFSSHENIYKDGLILPHSSLLSYLLFFGLVGLTIIFCSFLILIYKKRENTYILFLIMFLSINYLKSDSLLYFPNFVLLLFVLNYLYLKKSKPEEIVE